MVTRELSGRGGYRICLVSSDFLPNIGGIAAHVAGLAQGLSDLGHTVTVLSRTGATWEGTKDLRLINLPSSHLRYVRDLRFLLAGLAHNVRRLEFDVVHWHGLWGDTGVSRQLSPTALRVFTNHSSMFLRGMSSPVWRAVFKMWLSAADGVICPSEELLARTREVLPATPAVFIPNGVDTARFSPGEVEEGVPPVILAPRRLVDKNGLIYLVRGLPKIVHEIPTVALWLAGSGPEAQRLADEAEQLGVREHVKFLGAVSNRSMPELYRRASVVVIPSLMEATSIAALEASSCGKPVVSTNVGGLPFVVRSGETGLVVEPHDESALADAVIKILRNPEMGRALGQRGSDFVSGEFSWTQVARRTAAFYDQLLRAESARDQA